MSETYYGAVNDFRGYLKHHGIKGQKWGVRNGPPYPLDASDHSAAEKKAASGKKLSTSGSDISKKKVTPSKSSIFKNKKAGALPSKEYPVSEYWQYGNATEKARKIKKDYINNTFDKKDLKEIIKHEKSSVFLDKLFKLDPEDIKVSTEYINAAKARLKELNKMKWTDLNKAFNEEIQKRLNRGNEEKKRLSEKAHSIVDHYKNKQNRKELVNKIYSDAKKEWMDTLEEMGEKYEKGSTPDNWIIEDAIYDHITKAFDIEDSVEWYALKDTKDFDDFTDFIWDEVLDKF